MPKRTPINFDPTFAATVFVFALWLFCTTLIVVCVWRFGSNIPQRDDYVLILDIEKLASPTDYFHHIFKQSDQHFQPIGRLLQIINYRVANGDLRPSMYISCGLASLLSLTLIVGAWRIRGFTEITDALYPLIILSPALIINHTFFFVTAQAAVNLAVVAVPCLLVMATLRSSPRGRKTCICLLPLLPTMGSTGLVMAPACFLFLLLISLRWDLPKIQRLSAFVSSLLLTGFSFIYYFNYQSPSGRDYQKPLLDSLNVCLDFWAVSFGPLALIAPFSIFIRLATFVVAGLVLLGLLSTLRQRKITFQKFISLLAALPAAATLGIFVGFLRGGIQSYYISAATIFSVTAYSATLVSREDWGIIIARYTMFVLAAINFGYGYAYGSAGPREKERLAEGLIAAVESKMPMLEIASKFRDLQTPSVTEMRFRDQISALRDFDRKPFSEIEDKTKWSFDSVDLNGVRSHDFEVSGQHLRVEGESPEILLTIPERIEVRAIKIILQPSRPNGKPKILSLTARHEENGFPRLTEYRASTHYINGRKDSRPVTIWFDAAPSEVFIEFSNLELNATILSIELISIAGPKSFEEQQAGGISLAPQESLVVPGARGFHRNQKKSSSITLRCSEKV